MRCLLDKKLGLIGDSNTPNPLVGKLGGFLLGVLIEGFYLVLSFLLIVFATNKTIRGKTSPSSTKKIRFKMSEVIVMHLLTFID